MPDSGWKEADEAADKSMSGWLATVHRAGRECGLTRPDIDIDFAAKALYSMIEASLSSLDPASPSEDVERLVDQLARLQWHAIYTIEPEDSPIAIKVAPFLVRS
jgi:hypothetical protein